MCGILLTGGQRGGLQGDLRDVWHSYNGVQWSLKARKAGWAGRARHGVAVDEESGMVVFSGGQTSGFGRGGSIAAFQDTWTASGCGDETATLELCFAADFGAADHTKFKEG